MEQKSRSWFKQNVYFGKKHKSETLTERPPPTPIAHPIPSCLVGIKEVYLLKNLFESVTAINNCIDFGTTFWCCDKPICLLQFIVVSELRTPDC